MMGRAERVVQKRGKAEAERTRCIVIVIVYALCRRHRVYYWPFLFPVPRKSPQFVHPASL